MADTVTPFNDSDWGCEHYSLTDLTQDQIRVCLVDIKEIKMLATELTQVVANSSWMLDLDEGTRRSYQRTVAETAELLTNIFKSVMDAPEQVTEEFGELMVSMGSMRALEVVFGHVAVPLAELWKPQVKQNEGFDFHTVCQTPLIHFGEAKYSRSKSPHGLAIDQIEGFIADEKHFRDRVHLLNICSSPSIANFDNERFGVVAAFSVNGKNPSRILSNARDSALALAKKHSIEQIFLVGVKHEAD